MKINYRTISFPLSKTTSYTKKLEVSDQNWIEKSIERGDLSSVYSKFGVTATPFSIDF